MENLFEQNNIKIENKEGEPRTEVISSQDLIERIYQGGSTIRDERFLPFNDGGVFKYFDVGDLIYKSHIHESNRLYLIVELGDLIVGISELEQDPNDPNNFWIKFISVDQEYQSNRYASLLVEKIFEFAKQNNYSLELSFYSKQGLEKLKKVIDRKIEETGVKIVNRHN
ncbi:MAG: GNAT family N-acetyltransferase [Candidatus Pacebacteria bacterium]|nr:GNAT family N-acetyltransferase [Candidatus Paceibacterota bacterium]